MSSLAHHWQLDPTIAFCNHGSFGATPTVVLEAQRRYRDMMEREPVRFLIRQLGPMLDRVRTALSTFVGADACDIAFIPNATSGINSIVRSLRFEPGDELLTTDHVYNACGNVLEWVAQQSGATVVRASLPFPLQDSAQVTDAILSRVTDRTRLAMIDHIVSPTGLILPIHSIVSGLANAGVDCLVDGAHAPGMVDLNLNDLGAAYYVGNCHKWLCAPKGAGFLHARSDKQSGLVPCIISHGYNNRRDTHSWFQDQFDWIGTIDPTPWLCIAESIEFVQTLMPGGLEALRQHNRDLALRGRDLLCDRLGIAPPAPDEMIGSMASVPLPDDPRNEANLDRSTSPTPTPGLQTHLYDQFQIEVPVPYFPKFPKRMVRISAQAYNTLEQFQRIAEALIASLETESIDPSLL
jgi:isopenicillin-N epimerase